VTVIASLYLCAACSVDMFDQPAKTEAPDYAAVCVDPHTRLRIDDDQCDTAIEEFDGSDDQAIHSPGAGGYWYYYGTHQGVNAPPVGRQVTGGTFTRPHTPRPGQPGTPDRPVVIVRKGSVPKAGGSVNTQSVSKSGVVRGGLGVSGKGSGGAGS
jgi:hypothetical protein